MVAVQTLESMLVTFPSRGARYHLEDLKYLAGLSEERLSGVNDLFGKFEREHAIAVLFYLGRKTDLGWMVYDSVRFREETQLPSLEYLTSRGYLEYHEGQPGYYESTPVLHTLLALFHRCHPSARRMTAELFRIKHETELVRLGLILPEQDRGLMPSGDHLLDKIMEIRRMILSI